MTKIIEINVCEECPHMEEGTFSDWCNLLSSEITKENRYQKYPENCPLKDLP